MTGPTVGYFVSQWRKNPNSPNVIPILDGTAVHGKHTESGATSAGIATLRVARFVASRPGAANANPDRQDSKRQQGRHALPPP